VNVRARATLLVIAILCHAGQAAAQNVGITATVELGSPTGSGVRDLSFGVITPAVAMPTLVDVPAAAAPVSGTVFAGEYRFSVSSTRGVDFALSLPAQLQAPGLTPLPLSFNGAQYGGWCVTAGAAVCTLTAFNPTVGTVRVCNQTLGNGNCHPNRVFTAGSELAVYVGGLLTVPPLARAGTYSATVTLSIVQVY
jgi:hypothetical protein